jgi:hypothetical protein
MPTPTVHWSWSNQNASPHTPPAPTGHGSLGSGKNKSSWQWLAPKKKEPRRIPVTMVSNSVNEMTDSLLRSFIQSLNTGEVVYDVATVQPQQVLPEQQCIVGCVSASRLQSDVNATLALFTAHSEYVCEKVREKARICSLPRNNIFYPPPVCKTAGGYWNGRRPPPPRPRPPLINVLISLNVLGIDF